MELANAEVTQEPHEVRTAVHSDAGAITDLLRRSPSSHIHADWRLPVDWVGSPGFVVSPENQGVEKQRDWRRSSLFPPKHALKGCLAVAADPPPAAWVRIASLNEDYDSAELLRRMLAEVMDYLRESGVSELGWLVVQDWPNEVLPRLGFSVANEIETYVKADKILPRVSAVPDLIIRPVQPTDYTLLANLEVEAFTPLWRLSAESLNLAFHQAISFYVAELRGKVVGYQLSSGTGDGAHIVRLAVLPDFHKSGVGSSLLVHAIQSFNKMGIKRISLNTQVDNVASHLIYKKFGFVKSGHRYPVWVLTI
jgi:ribosomal-protein-alanine N-acetyltransferase